MFKNDRLKSLRKNAGFSLETVGKQVGTSKSYIWELEKGTTQPSGKKVFLLSKYFGVSMEYFYTDKDLPVSEACRIGSIILNEIRKKTK